MPNYRRFEKENNDTIKCLERMNREQRIEFFKKHSLSRGIPSVKVIGIVYSGPNKIGDFMWMSRIDHQRNELGKNLYIFGDSEKDHNTSNPGINSAIMRQFNKYSGLIIPYSFGIPTGNERGGYSSLNAYTMHQINMAFEELEEDLVRYSYEKIYFSANPDGLIGTNSHDVGWDVINYITEKMIALSSYSLQIIDIQ